MLHRYLNRNVVCHIFQPDAQFYRSIYLKVMYMNLILDNIVLPIVLYYSSIVCGITFFFLNII